MMDSFKTEWAKRPGWMNLIWFFCLYMTFIYMPFDIFIKIFTQTPSQWEEIWFGYTLRGWEAKATEPVHWLIYGAGAYGFWKMKSWMWPWAAVYCFQVVIAMAVFTLLKGPVEFDGRLAAAAVAAAIFMVPTVALWRAKALFKAESSPEDPVSS
jgi:uncharacterized membrane protein (DUF2068 family)